MYGVKCERCWKFKLQNWTSFLLFFLFFRSLHMYSWFCDLQTLLYWVCSSQNGWSQSIIYILGMKTAHWKVQGWNSELDSKQSDNLKFWYMTMSAMTACNRFSTAVEYDDSKTTAYFVGYPWKCTQSCCVHFQVQSDHQYLLIRYRTVIMKVHQPKLPKSKTFFLEKVFLQISALLSFQRVIAQLNDEKIHNFCLNSQQLIGDFFCCHCFCCQFGINPANHWSKKVNNQNKACKHGSHITVMAWEKMWSWVGFMLSDWINSTFPLSEQADQGFATQ